MLNYTRPNSTQQSNLSSIDKNTLIFITFFLLQPSNHKHTHTSGGKYSPIRKKKSNPSSQTDQYSEFPRSPRPDCIARRDSDKTRAPCTVYILEPIDSPRRASRESGQHDRSLFFVARPAKTHLSISLIPSCPPGTFPSLFERPGRLDLPFSRAGMRRIVFDFDTRAEFALALRVALLLLVLLFML